MHGPLSFIFFLKNFDLCISCNLRINKHDIFCVVFLMWLKLKMLKIISDFKFLRNKITKFMQDSVYMMIIFWTG